MPAAKTLRTCKTALQNKGFYHHIVWYWHHHICGLASHSEKKFKSSWYGSVIPAKTGKRYLSFKNKTSLKTKLLYATKTINILLLVFTILFCL